MGMIREFSLIYGNIAVTDGCRLKPDHKTQCRAIVSPLQQDRIVTHVDCLLSPSNVFSAMAIRNLLSTSCFYPLAQSMELSYVYR